MESKFFKHSWGSDQLNKTRDFFHFCKDNVKQLVFADLSDSSNFVISDALELTDKYFKNQILLDKKKYLKNFYGRRIFSDYYNKKFKIKDKKPEKYKIPRKIDLKKIKLSWNSCFSNYTFLGSFMQKVYGLLPFNFLLFYPKRNNITFDKLKNLNCRMSLNYSKESIAFQRNHVAKLLSKICSFKKVSKLKYYNDLKISKIVISPFGYGEINLRDFEAFLNACILFKPNMDHLETWPNLYIKNKTYIDFNWNLNDLILKLENVLAEYNKYNEVGINGFRLYNRILDSKDMDIKFCERFKKLLMYN